MSLVGEAVLERSRTFCEGFGDMCGDEDCAERGVTAGNTFADEDEVRFAQFL